MIIAILKELTENENRVAATPQSVKDLIKNGVSVNIESGAGDSSFISDDDYKQSGANICSSPKEAIKDCDIIVKVNPPSKEEIDTFPEGKAFISFIQTTKELEIVNRLAKRKIDWFFYAFNSANNPRSKHGCFKFSSKHSWLQSCFKWSLSSSSLYAIIDDCSRNNSPC